MPPAAVADARWSTPFVPTRTIGSIPPTLFGIDMFHAMFNVPLVIASTGRTTSALPLALLCPTLSPLNVAFALSRTILGAAEPAAICWPISVWKPLPLPIEIVRSFK